MSGLPATQPELVRVAAPRRGAAGAVAAVVLALVAVVGIGLVGGSGAAVSKPASGAGGEDRAAVLNQTLAARSARSTRLGPPPWAYNGRAPRPTDTRLRVLGWQADPYET